MVTQSLIETIPSIIDPSASAYDRFFQTAYERQRIWYRRFVLKQDAPWTDDPVMAKYSFTNVLRELDRGTVFYQREVRDKMAQRGASDGDLLMATILYRMFNRISTWEQSLADPVLAGRFNISEIEERLRSQNGPVFTSAHMVCAYHGMPGADKIARVCGFLGDIIEDRDDLAKKLQAHRFGKNAFEELTAFDGIGPFNGYEIYSDLLYCGDRFFSWDENQWANVGPGAHKGLKAIFPNEPPCVHLMLMVQLRDEQEAAFERLGLGDFYQLVPGEKRLTLRSIEHWSCEFQKHNRGTCRTTFEPHSDATLYGPVT
jgi:hypothetical protein